MAAVDRAGAVEAEYLDAIFDNDALEREVQELASGDFMAAGGGGGAGFGSSSARNNLFHDNMGGFGAAALSDKVLARIKRVRRLQQEVFHDHVQFEMGLTAFMQDKQGKVSRAEASDQFTAEFREQFKDPEGKMERVGELLKELAESVEGVNALVQENAAGATAAAAGIGSSRDGRESVSQ